MKIIRKRISELHVHDIQSIESFLDSHFSTIFHEPNFNRIAAEALGTDFFYYLASDEGGRLIGICPVHVKKDGFLWELHSSLAMYDIPYGGWVFENECVSLSELIHHMKMAFNEAFIYWSMPQFGEDDYESMETNRQFQTVFIDLSLPTEDILNDMSRSRRQSIKAACKKGVEVERLDPDKVDVFLEQCRFLKRSIGVSPFPEDFFLKLFDHYSVEDKIAAFATKLNDNYLGSGVLIRNKFMTHLWIAGKSQTASDLGPRHELLYWESIKWAKASGSQFYDLCKIEPERLPQIAQFKLSFSKTVIPFYYCLYRKKSFLILSKLLKNTFLLGSPKHL